MIDDAIIAITTLIEPFDAGDIPHQTGPMATARHGLNQIDAILMNHSKQPVRALGMILDVSSKWAQ